MHAKSINPKDQLRSDFITRFVGREESLLGYLQFAGILMPNEGLEDVPTRWVPINESQINALDDAVSERELGGVVGKPFEANWDQELDPPKEKKKRKATQQDLIDGPEPRACGGLCILNRW